MTRAALFHLGQLLGQRINAGVHMAAVQLQLGLTSTAAGTAAAATAAALTAQRFAHALQAGQTVAQQRQFGLQFALVGHGAAAENLRRLPAELLRPSAAWPTRSLSN